MTDNLVGEVLEFDDILQDHLNKTLHLSPKVAVVMFPVAKEAIERANKGDLDTRLSLPKGIRTLDTETREYHDASFVSDVIHFCQLYKFLDKGMIDRELEKMRKSEIG